MFSDVLSGAWEVGRKRASAVWVIGPPVARAQLQVGLPARVSSLESRCALAGFLRLTMLSETLEGL